MVPVIERPITIELNCSKTLIKNMEGIAKENAEKYVQDSTLYNFGYAPKEVIEKFQCFCYQYSSLSEAIQSLLQRDKLLKIKYRFLTPPVTYQMLAKPTIHDQPNSVRLAMVSLHKYMKQGRYKSVADAIEELLFGVDCSTTKTKSVGVNTSGKFKSDSEFMMISDAEHEALCKIADVLMQKLQERSKPHKVTKHVKKMPKMEHNRPVAINNFSTIEEPKSSSPKNKLKVRNASPVRQKQKSRKLSIDPEYFPKGTKKCLWSKVETGKDSPEQIDSLMENNNLSNDTPSQEHFERLVDVELLTPLCKFDPLYKCKSESVVKRHVFVGPNSKSKTLYMFQNLSLVPKATPMIMDGFASTIDLTSDI